jgi:hypothetical protein
MAHIFPKNKFSSDTPIDPDEVNANVRVVTNEVQGRLNEHNWQQNAFGTLDLPDKVTTVGVDSAFDRDMVFAWRKASVIVDHDLYDLACTRSGCGQSPGTTSAPVITGAFEIPSGYGWSVVDSMDVTIATQASMLWTTASFQVFVFRYNPTAITTFNPGIQFAIAVDGSVLPGTVVGSLDRSNDPRGEGLACFAHGITMDAIVPVTAGLHKIQVYARMCSDIDYTVRTAATSTSADNESVVGWVGQRELIILEMR